MNLRPEGARPPLPIPLSVLLTLLWVGLVRLLFLLVTAQFRLLREGEAWMALLLEQRVLGPARLPTMLVAISFLLLLYLWLDYRSRPAGGRMAWIFLAAAALLVYLGWAVWHSWWSQLELLRRPADMLMTWLPSAAAAAAAG